MGNFGEKMTQDEIDDIYGEFDFDDNKDIFTKSVVDLFVAGAMDEKKEEEKKKPQQQKEAKREQLRRKRRRRRPPSKSAVFSTFMSRLCPPLKRLLAKLSLFSSNSITFSFTVVRLSIKL